MAEVCWDAEYHRRFDGKFEPVLIACKFLVFQRSRAAQTVVGNN